MELKKGTFLQGDKYKIEHIIGRGGFGITYLVSQKGLSGYVAVKEFFFREYCDRADDGVTVIVPSTGSIDLVKRFENKFLKEARLISSLHHPGIVRVSDVFSENGTSYYTMEYIDGCSLAEYINSNGKLKEDEAVKITKEIASALAYLHARHINHLDIKPANVMIENLTGRIVLIDFGISKQYDPETGSSTTTTPLGISNGYSPLEQYKKNGIGKFSPCSDIYSLGATLYKMITGKTPPSAIEVSQNGLPTFPEGVSARIRNVIKASMSSIIQNRPQSVESFLDMMDGNDITVIPSYRHKRKKKTVVIASLVVLMVMVAGVMFYMSNYGSHLSDNTVMADTVSIDTLAGSDRLSAEAEQTGPIRTSMKSSRYGESSLDVEYPESGNPVLLQNIREWINETLGGTYDKSLDDTDAFFRHYADKLKNVDEGLGEYSKTKISKAYENSKIVTYIVDTDFYGGGVHGISNKTGVTFRKSDGKIFTNDLISEYYNLKPAMARGLRQYFDVSSNEELMSRLQLSDVGSNPTVDDIPVPSNNPWITADGIVFTYAPYEIACFADGSPTFTLPVETVAKYVTATAKTFFE